MSSEKNIDCFGGVTVIDTEYDSDQKVAATSFIVDDELHEIRWTSEMKLALFSVVSFGGENE